jgi:levoglucosan kinase
VQLRLRHHLPHILIIGTMAIKQWSGKPLSLKVIGTNAGTSMDGLDIAHIHYTQESPDAPLKMRLLRAGEVAFDGALKSNCRER